MIAYIKESVPVSFDSKKLLKLIKETKDPLYKAFQGNIYTLTLPDGKPGNWFRKEVKANDGTLTDVLVYSFSIVQSALHNVLRRRFYIRVWSGKRNDSFAIGRSVMDIEGKKYYPDEFKETLMKTKAIRDKVKKLSTESNLMDILLAIYDFSTKMRWS